MTGPFEDFFREDDVGDEPPDMEDDMPIRDRLDAMIEELEAPHVVYPGCIRYDSQGNAYAQQCGNDPGRPHLSFLTGTDLDFDILQDE